MSKTKRAYHKTSQFWTRIKNPETALAINPASPQHIEATAAFAGDKQVVAACGGVGSSNVLRNQWAPAIAENNLYPNISAGIMPFSEAGGYYTMSVPINLVTLAYFNIPLIRNTINLLQDFSISPLRIRTPNKTVKAFFTKWFEAIQLPDFISQFFLEYYRSGNIFIYQFDGKIEEDKFNKLKTTFSAAKSPVLPIRFTLLDPKQVYLQIGPTSDSTYSRMLSTFELQRLRDPKTPEDKQVLKNFPPEIQRQIKNYSSQPFVYVPLDTNRLYYAFYRKQPYEPLAVPMIWPLLNRLEYKLMLERMDMSLVQTMEQVLLHVASGSQRDERNPGTNPEYLKLLTQMFQSQAIGRVLVTDHNTKLEWKIPDLKELLGKGKYEQVCQDIREGLGHQFFGDEKFANAAIKAKMFVEALKEGRRIFLDNFLRPQVKAVCESLGFKNIPTLEFEKIDVEDKTALQRIYVQMAQLGLLTDDELNEALNSGILPTKEESLINQKAYKAERADELYQPLIGAPKGPDEQGRPSGGPGAKMPGKKTGKIGVKSSYQFNTGTLIENLASIVQVHEAVEKGYKKTYKLDELNESQAALALAVAKSIVLNEPKDEWVKSVKAYVKTPKNIPEEIISDLTKIANEFPEDCAKNPWTVVALYKSQVTKEE